MAAPKRTADFNAAVQAFQSLKMTQKEPGWGTTWQLACEAFWDGLSHDLNTIPANSDTFVDLLADNERFQLARMVIKQLRDPHIPATAEQRNILERVNDKITGVIAKESITQAYFDDDAYAFEKRIISESEMHRARVYLNDAGPYNDSEYQQRIQEWLQDAPKRAGPSGEKDEER
jgi:hypothetical protein